MILNNFFRRNGKPLIFYPGIPPIFWIPFVTGLYLKFRLYGVGYPATEKRFFVSVWMLGVVRSFETLKPMLVSSVWPIAARKSSVESTRGTDATNPAARPRRRIVTLFSLFLWNKAVAAALWAGRQDLLGPASRHLPPTRSFNGQANRWRPKPQCRIGSMVTLPLPAFPAVHGRLFFFIGNEGGRLCV